MKLSEVVHILDATLLVGAGQRDIEVFKGGASDMLSAILAGGSQQSLLLTGLLSTQVIRTAIIADVAAVVFVNARQPAPEIVRQAREGGLPLLSTPYAMFVACGRLYQRGLTGLDGTR